MTASNSEYRHIPEATVSRLPVYLRSLLDLSEQDVTTVSSENLAAETGVNAAKVRKDLSYLGTYGTRGVGYGVGELVDQIRDCLGLNRNWRVGIAGIGNLGRALVNYKGFSERKLTICALYDSDPEKVGRPIKVGDDVLTIQDVESIRGDVGALDLDIGIITTPSSVAQDVADRYVAGGIQGILNFAPTVLRVPEDVMLRKVDLSIELQILGFYVGRRDALDRAVEAAD